jgi:hypothetical protein
MHWTRASYRSPMQSSHDRAPNEAMRKPLERALCNPNVRALKRRRIRSMPACGRGTHHSKAKGFVTDCGSWALVIMTFAAATSISLPSDPAAMWAGERKMTAISARTAKGGVRIQVGVQRVAAIIGRRPFWRKASHTVASGRICQHSGQLASFPGGSCCSSRPRIRACPSGGSAERLERVRERGTSSVSSSMRT